MKVTIESTRKLLVADSAGHKATMQSPVTVSDVSDPKHIMVGSDRSISTAIQLYPKMDVTRIYNPTKPYKPLSVVPATVTPIMSYKGATDVAYLNTYIGQQKRMFFLDTLHEMNRSTANGGPTPAAYKSDFILMDTTLKAHPDTAIYGNKSIEIFMGYAARHPETGREWDKFWTDVADAIGFDLEKDTKSWPTGLPPVKDFMDIALQAAAKVGKPLYLCEYAYERQPDDPTGTKLAQWYQDSYDYFFTQTICEAGGIIAYDFPGSTGNYTLVDPELQVWQAITANH